MICCCQKTSNNETAWQKAAEIGQGELLEKLWDWAKELQLKPEELIYSAVIGKEAVSTILPPFSGKLTADTELTVNRDDIK
jgi:hypothetical protein